MTGKTQEMSRFNVCELKITRKERWLQEMRGECVQIFLSGDFELILEEPFTVCKGIGTALLSGPKMNDGHVQLATSRVTSYKPNDTVSPNAIFVHQ
jgi:hypothetical protein